MINEISRKIVSTLAESLDIPDSAYEAAASRYHDLGNWLHDPTKAKSAQYSPDISPQGSFRFGTAIRPLAGEDYDLDLSCCLRIGLSKSQVTQEQIKNILGEDLEVYRKERGIREELEPKHRCWRLYYMDHLKFHVDTVPSIPQTNDTRQLLQERMIKAGSDRALAQTVAESAVAITDDRHPNYRQITNDWLISNPEGYAKWFESRMLQAQQLLRSRAMMEKVSKIDDLPTYRWKTPLQRSIQILKRHRDLMFEKNLRGKPISIIITTLAARAYEGEPDIELALENILAKIGRMVSQSRPRVPNPVNPQEDFTDRWGTEEGHRLKLEENFWLWLEQAKSDFEVITRSRDTTFVAEQAKQKYGVRLDDKALGRIFGGVPTIITSPRTHQISSAPKPWRE